MGSTHNHRLPHGFLSAILHVPGAVMGGILPAFLKLAVEIAQAWKLRVVQVGWVVKGVPSPEGLSLLQPLGRTLGPCHPTCAICLNPRLIKKIYRGQATAQR